jgi:trimethylamine--corrinoid protein Co-methyltransferase
MTSMGSWYTPTSYLLNLACAEIMHYFGIPHCGTSGSNNGRGADLAAAGDLWINHLTSCLGKVGCVPFVGGNFESMAFSPTTVILSNHIIGEARTFAEGFTIGDDMVNLQEISRVRHGGDFFTSEQTLASLTGPGKKNPPWSMMNLESWKERGMPKSEDELTALSLELYARAQQASRENLDIIRKGEELIATMLSSPMRRD